MDRTATTAPPSDVPDRGARQLVLVWAVLLAATALTLGLHEGLGAGAASLLAVLAVTFVKTWLVGQWFMELRGAPTVLRRLLAAWCVLVPVGLAAITLLL